MTDPFEACDPRIMNREPPILGFGQRASCNGQGLGLHHGGGEFLPPEEIVVDEPDFRVVGSGAASLFRLEQGQTELPHLAQRESTPEAEGSPTSASTAITLLSGVEPILQAAPSAGQAMMLAPWSLGGAPGGDQ